MKKSWKKMISMVIACLMVITLVPFTGSRVNAAKENILDKVALSFGNGELMIPGYDANIPDNVNIEFDKASSGTIGKKAIDNNKLSIGKVCWQLKDPSEESGWADIECTMSVDAGEVYRLYIDLYSELNGHGDVDDYVFDGTTSVYVEGTEWHCTKWDLGNYAIISPEYTITSTGKAVSKGTTQQPTPTANSTPTPNTQQPAAQPTNQPSDLSTKITGAPKNLVCSISKGNARQIDVEFEPDLECGIDKNSGAVIAASTDNKATWQKVVSWDFVSGNKDLKWNTYALSGSTYFKMDLEKTYYVKAYYVDSEGKKGPDSNICGPFGPVEDESKIPGKVEEASKTAVKTTGNDAGVLKKGTSVTFERAFYKLTLSVKDIKGSDVIFTVNLEPNKPYDTYLFMEHGSIRYTTKKDKPQDVMDTVGETTIDMTDMIEGCTKITIPVTATLRQKYDINQKKYKFEETLYFDNAPQALSPGVTKADKKSITFGKAYSAAVNCTDSGTTVYYKKKGAAKWKEKTFASGKTMKLTGLSAGTSYQIKAVNFVKSKDRNGKEKTIKGTESSVSIFRTAYKSAPKTKSVKTSKVKQKTRKFAGKWVKSGIHTKWQKPYTLKVTTYKLTIKMKSKPTNAGGIVVKDPDGVVHVIKGSKNKYTLSGEIKGYKKGQKVKFKVATFGNGETADVLTGVSPYKTITVKMK